MRKIQLSVLTGILLVTLSVGALAQSVSVEKLECVPVAHNAPVQATVQGDQPGTTVRLFFRRMHDEVEDFYWVQMHPGPDGYWAVLPRPEDRKLNRHDLDDPPDDVEDDELWAAWWRAKEASQDRDPNDDLDDEIIRERASVGGEPEDRAWMSDLDNEALQTWLEGLENEPVEYFAVVYNANNQEIAQSAMRSTEVLKDCPVTLEAPQAGEALNLTVGETAPWQEGKKVFHWLCDGIVTRVNDEWIPRADEVCRSCVVAFLMKEDFLVPATLAGIGGITTIIITDDPNPSPTLPNGL